MSGPMIKESAFLAAMQGVLGEEHPACRALALEDTNDGQLYPAGFLMEDFIRHFYVPAMPQWERAVLTLQLAADPHGFDINPGQPPRRR